MKTLCTLVISALLAGCAGAPDNRPTCECAPCVMAEDEECRVVHVDASTPKAEWNGKTYYFCSEECRDKFKADPAKYAPAVDSKHN